MRSGAASVLAFVVISACQAEDRVLEAYERAVADPLPPLTSSLVTAQRDEVRIQRKRIHDLEDRL